MQAGTWASPPPLPCPPARRWPGVPGGPPPAPVPVPVPVAPSSVLAEHLQQHPMLLQYPCYSNIYCRHLYQDKAQLSTYPRQGNLPPGFYRCCLPTPLLSYRLPPAACWLRLPAAYWLRPAYCLPHWLPPAYRLVPAGSLSSDDVHAHPHCPCDAAGSSTACPATWI